MLNKLFVKLNYFNVIINKLTKFEDSVLKSIFAKSNIVFSCVYHSNKATRFSLPMVSSHSSTRCGHSISLPPFYSMMGEKGRTMGHSTYPRPWWGDNEFCCMGQLKQPMNNEKMHTMKNNNEGGSGMLLQQRTFFCRHLFLQCKLKK